MIIEVLRAFDYKIREGTVHKSKLEGLEMGRHEWVHDYTYVLVCTALLSVGEIMGHDTISKERFV